MPGMRYARGERAWGICGRSGARALLKDLVFDGRYPNMRVLPSWWEPRDPLDYMPRVEDPIALWRPAPESLPQPTAPVLTGEVVSDDAQLEWTESTTPASQVDTYLLYRRRDDEEDYMLLLTFAVTRDFLGGITEDLEYLDASFATGHFFDYYVIGVAVQGGQSPPSNVVRLGEDLEADVLVTDDGDPIVTDGGDEILVEG